MADALFFTVENPSSLNDFLRRELPKALNSLKAPDGAAAESAASASSNARASRKAAFEMGFMG